VGQEGRREEGREGRREGGREGGSTYIIFSRCRHEIADGEHSKGNVDGSEDIS